MPLYDYRCEKGHTTTLLLRADMRQDETTCGTCGDEARYTLAAPARGLVVGTETPGGIRSSSGARDGFTITYESPTFVVREKGNSLTRADYRCPDGHEFGDDYEGEPPVNPTCPVCMAESRRVVVAADLDWITKDHPHGWYDPALGRFIRDRAHWEQVKREMGVIDGDFRQAWQDQMRRDAEEARYDEDEVRKMLAGYVRGPDAALMHRVAEENPELDWRPWARELGLME